ncbi:MAG: M48 family metallopeptidase [Mariprofundaceae bacterium]|nr:M48 family metallopeptidase [Mariprofundaceae bacterium]
MNFFGYQEKARRNSAVLVALFILAIALITVAVYGAVVVGAMIGQLFFIDQQAGFYGFSSGQLWNVELFLWISAATLLVILGGSAYRIHTLSQGGGAAVAEMLGGSRLPASVKEPLDRRLLNVVEEMAIASGLPVPPVFMLEQSGINAFAAGFTPSDTVIGVTRGAVELLSRDELQGVIAHEFSHIFNGDSAMKMRMMGLLYGITLVSDTGIGLMTMKRTSRFSRDRGSHPGIIVIGFLLFIVGTVGLVIADMIKRAVSRQREYLADAAAVQFTRNPTGIGNALKVIGGYRQGSTVNHSATGQASHFFFGNALKSWYHSDWWATHPPLEERIRRIDPGFKGRFDKVDSQARSFANQAQAAADFMVSSGSQVAHLQVNPDAVLAMVGNPGPESLQEARAMLKKMPARVRDFAHDPYTARAAVYALLLDPDTSQRKVQLSVLEKTADPNVFRETLDILPDIGGLSSELRLPLAEMVMPALKEMSLPQYRTFKKSVGALIKADHQVSLFEFALYRMVIRRLQGEFGRSAAVEVRYHRMKALLPHCRVLLTVLARTGHGEEGEKPFAESMSLLAEGEHTMLAGRESRLSHFDQALTRLNMAAPALKERVLKAALHCVLCNGVVFVKEGELLRVIADGLDCPLPPLTMA